MEIQTDINWIQKELENIKDPMIIKVIKNRIEYRKKDLNHKRISIEQYNKELDESIADIQLGNFKTHNEVQAMMATWGSK